MEKTKINIKRIIGLAILGVVLLVAVMVISNWDLISQAFMIGYADAL